MAHFCSKCHSLVYDYEETCPLCNTHLGLEYKVNFTDVCYTKNHKKGINFKWLIVGGSFLLLFAVASLVLNFSNYNAGAWYTICASASIVAPALGIVFLIFGFTSGKTTVVQSASCPYCGRIISPLSETFNCKFCNRPIIRIKNKLKNAEPLNTAGSPLPNISLEEMKNRFFQKWELRWQCKPQQQERLARAKSENIILRMERFNSDNGTALCFSSKYETNRQIYEVTYNSCTCPDFTKRKDPCKHIYALVLNLGIFPEDEDLSGIPTVIKHKIELLPEQSFASFKKLLREHDDFTPFYINVSSRIKPLLNCGLLTDAGTSESLLDMAYTRNDLVAKIYENNINYKPTSSNTKKEIISYLVKNEPDFVQKLSKSHSIVRFGDELASILINVRNFYCENLSEF